MTLRLVFFILVGPLLIYIGWNGRRKRQHEALYALILSAGIVLLLMIAVAVMP